VARKIALCFLILALAGLLSAWLYADARYDYTVYARYQTDEIVETHEDRLAGYRVELVPIYEPDNPAWVVAVRKVAPLSLLVLALGILYMFIPAIDARLSRCKPSHLPNIPD